LKAAERFQGCFDGLFMIMDGPVSIFVENEDRVSSASERVAQLHQHFRVRRLPDDLPLCAEAVGHLQQQIMQEMKEL